jgi:hypothetical protein
MLLRFNFLGHWGKVLSIAFFMITLISCNSSLNKGKDSQNGIPISLAENIVGISQQTLVHRKFRSVEHLMPLLFAMKTPFLCWTVSQIFMVFLSPAFQKNTGIR